MTKEEYNKEMDKVDYATGLLEAMAIGIGGGMLAGFCVLILALSIKLY